jgi:hypothetical protein
MWISEWQTSCGRFQGSAAGVHQDLGRINQARGTGSLHGFWLLLVLLLSGLSSIAQPQKAELAIIVAEKRYEPLADILTAKLSSHSDVVLLERAQVNRILAEQTLTLSAAE